MGLCSLFAIGLYNVPRYDGVATVQWEALPTSQANSPLTRIVP
jgi:hypothetical protein